MGIEFQEPRLTWDTGRVFIDIATNGCGSNCSYCYIAAPAAEQSLATYDDIDNTLNALLSDARFLSGRHGTMISMSPSSEPFKSAESTSAMIHVLRRLLPLGNPVQIPTKESVPDSLLECLDDVGLHASQTVIFVSLSSIAAAQKIEPNAASIAVRLENTTRLRGHNCRSCAYIKPFLAHAINEVELFAAALNSAEFDAICVGMRYFARRVDGPVKHYSAERRVHPVEQNFEAQGLTPNLTSFYQKLAGRCAPTPVFLTSLCVNSYLVDRVPPIPIWQDLPSLCVGCRPCGKRTSA